ncbi:MAG: hypothetical protein ABIJ36_01095 [Patescibacteria group bacterium]
MRIWKWRGKKHKNRALVLFGLLLSFLILLFSGIVAMKNRSFRPLEERYHPVEELVSQINYSKIKFEGSKTCVSTSYNTNLGNVQDIIGYQNNKFGLYIYAEEDYVELAGDLVNSNGGDWGYVLIPINVRDYDGGKWREVFRKLNEKHLIPILQLWDLSKEDEEGQLKECAQLLDSLEWPIKKRFVSVFNEPNDSRFWREGADPSEYAEVLDKTIAIFKNQNENFFMLNGAFNSSARNGDGYIDEEEFIIAMNKAVPGIFNKLDGWASHPYPQPAYRGSPFSIGRDSIKAYDWDLNLLNKLFGVNNLPVFITETGWAHREGIIYNDNFLSQDVVASYFVKAFKEVWGPDTRVVAVTPFTIRYNPPFDHFSWIDFNENFYPQFRAVQSLPKIKGLPPYLIKKEVVCE